MPDCEVLEEKYGNQRVLFTFHNIFFLCLRSSVSSYLREEVFMSGE